jgi:hypothetical protein
MGGMRNAYNTFVGKPEGKRPLRRSWGRWKDNIRMDLKETGWTEVNWMHLVQDIGKWQAFVNMIMFLQIS